MSPRSAIVVDNICKAYRITVRAAAPDTLVGAIQSLARSPVHNFRHLRSLTTVSHRDTDDVVWALRDVSFEVA